MNVAKIIFGLLFAAAATVVILITRRAPLASQQTAPTTTAPATVAIPQMNASLVGPALADIASLLNPVDAILTTAPALLPETPALASAISAMAPAAPLAPTIAAPVSEALIPAVTDVATPAASAGLAATLITSAIGFGFPLFVAAKVITADPEKQAADILEAQHQDWLSRGLTEQQWQQSQILSGSGGDKDAQNAFDETY